MGSHCHLLAGRDTAKQDTRAAGRRALTARVALRAADHGLRLPPYVLLRHERRQAAALAVSSAPGTARRATRSARAFRQSEASTATDPRATDNSRNMVIRNQADSGLGVWSPQCQSSRLVVGGLILIPTARRACGFIPPPSDWLHAPVGCMPWPRFISPGHQDGMGWAWLPPALRSTSPAAEHPV